MGLARPGTWWESRSAVIPRSSKSVFIPFPGAGAKRRYGAAIVCDLTAAIYDNETRPVNTLKRGLRAGSRTGGLSPLHYTQPLIAGVRRTGRSPLQGLPHCEHRCEPGASDVRKTFKIGENFKVFLRGWHPVPQRCSQCGQPLSGLRPVGRPRARSNLRSAVGRI